MNISYRTAWIIILAFLVAFHEVSPSQDEVLHHYTSPDVLPDIRVAEQYYSRAQVFYESAHYDSANYYFYKAKDIYEFLSGRIDSDDIWEGILRCYNRIAWAQVLLSKFDAAIPYLEFALEKGLERFGEDHAEVARTYHYLGGIYYRYRSDYDRALDKFNKSLSIRLRVLGDDHPEVGTSHYDIGVIYYFKGNFKRALEQYQTALSIRVQAFGEIHRNVADTYKDIGAVFGREGDMDRALEYQNKALSIYRQVLEDTHPQIAAIYHNIGIIHKHKGDYDLALEMAQKSLNIMRIIHGENHLDVARRYGSIADVYYDIGDYEQSLEYHRKALSIRLHAFGENHADVPISYTGIAMAYKLIGENDRALEYDKKALSINLKLFGENHPRIAHNYNNIGSGYWRKGDHRLAYDYYQKALAIRLQIFNKEHPDLAAGYYNIGLCYFEFGDFSRAFEYYRKALAAWITLYGEKHPRVSVGYRAIARTYAEKNDIDNALAYTQQSIISLVRDFDDASFYSHPPLSGINSEPYLLSSLKLRAELLFKRAESAIGTSKRPDLEMALETYRLSADLIDQIRTGYKAAGSKLLLGEEVSDVFEDAIRTSLVLFDLTGEEEYKHHAYYFVEKSKAAVLQDAITEAQAMQFSGIPEGLLREEKQLRIDMAYYDTRVQQEYLNRSRGTGDKLGDYESRLFDLKMRYRELTDLFESKYPDYYELKYQTQTITVPEIQDVLPENTALLEYFTGDEKMYIFVVSKTGFEIVTVNLPDDFMQLETDFYTSILKSETATYITSASRLNTLLVSPVMPHISSKERLVIIPHEYLYKIPFEALLTETPVSTDRPGRVDFRELRYLLKSFDISYHYSVKLFIDGLRTMTVSPAGLKSFIGYAPVFSKDDEAGYALASEDIIELASHYEELMRSVVIDGKRFEELKYSEWEIKSIIELFADIVEDRASSAYFHSRATKESFKSSAGEYRIVHIATHSFINEFKPQLSGIVFARSDDPLSDTDAILYAGETYNLDLNADLVVLSSCESGVGKLVRGEGMMALSRGFLYSGARNIVFSLWKIPDRHTSELMVEFYRQMLSGNSYAESLRNAKLSLIENPATARPRSWASFVLVGTD
jgi:CHAT domain-containing protein/tetratricopeptide (TPR) repeat protein